MHLRLRFQNLGKPRTAGLCGWAAGACDCGPLSVLKSNGLRYSKNLPVKFGFSPIDTPANIAKKLPSQRCSKPFFIPIFNFSHKWPTFAFVGESGYTRHPSPEPRTQRLTRRNRGRFGRGRYYYPQSVPHVSETLRGLVSERQTLPLLGLGRGCSQRTQRACGTAMRLCMSLFRGVEAPLSCVAFFRFCRNYGFHTLRSGLSVCARRGGWYHYPRCALRVVETLDGRLSKRLICRFLGLTCSSLTAAQNTVLFGHGIPTEKRLNRQRLIPPPAGRCGSNTAVSRSPGLSRGPRCPAPARTPQVSAPAP